MKKIVPSLWFGDNNCEEAINYYVNVFPNSENNMGELIKTNDQMEAMMKMKKIIIKELEDACTV